MCHRVRRAGCADRAADPVAKDLEALDWFVAEDESHMATGHLVAHPTMGVAATLHSSRRADASIGSTLERGHVEQHRPCA